MRYRQGPGGFVREIMISGEIIYSFSYGFHSYIILNIDYKCTHGQLYNVQCTYKYKYVHKYI